MSDYLKYKKEFLDDLRISAECSGSDTQNEFLIKTLSMLESYDEIQDTEVMDFGDKRCSGNKIMRADAYSFDETDHSLVLIIQDFQDKYDTDNLTMSRIDELYWRMYNFLDEICHGNIDRYFDDSDDMVKVSRFIRSKMNIAEDDANQILKIKLFIITNKELSTDLLGQNLLETKIKKGKNSKTVKSNKKIKKGDFDGRPIEINLWYLERFYNVETKDNGNPIIIDFVSDFNYAGIPCLKGNIGENLGYEAYMSIIPGWLLSKIYIEYGSKVLEGNVRAFLGTSGSKSVNSGIRRTINNEPNKFFTYNNGIATTAEEVETVEKDGKLLITKIVDLQIINGGQTTASLAEAVLKRTNVNLDGIFVPMKLTVIEDRQTVDDDGISFYDSMVKAIANYANSQNKVTASDLFSNDPFHIQMEKLSKATLADPARYSIPTGWYYERSRKRYLQEQIKLTSDAQKRFVAKFPKDQVITKEQLGMYLTAYALKPHIVAKGKNYVIKEFNAMVSESFRKHKEYYNEGYYKKCVCKAIIYRTVDDYLESNKDSVKKPTGFWYKAGGYKGDIVPYTIAKIIHSIPKDYELDWNLIWKKQKLSSAFMREIEIVTKMANDFICDSHGIIVTEYCKKEDTWIQFRDTVKYSPSQEFINELISSKLGAEIINSERKDQRQTNDLKAGMDIVTLGVNFWQNLLQVGLQRRVLTYPEQIALKQAVDSCLKGNILPMRVVKNIIAVKEKLESMGIKGN